ncbi:MAG: hypothetical protein COA78_24760 [Blastopirellula sp.]|nr:MAG: hypothetical protein COA78_24760 [Blastopirellula sp.]
MAFEEDGMIGGDAKTYYNTGTHAIPVWVEITRIKDAKTNINKKMVELPAREGKGIGSRGSKITPELSFSYLYKKGTDTVFDALMDSLGNNTPIEFYAADDDVATSGTEGLRCVMEVSSIPMNQGLEDGVYLDIETKYARVTESDVLIEWDWHVIP